MPGIKRQRTLELAKDDDLGVALQGIPRVRRVSLGSTPARFDVRSTR